MKRKVARLIQIVLMEKCARQSEENILDGVLRDNYSVSLHSVSTFAKSVEEKFASKFLK